MASFEPSCPREDSTAHQLNACLLVDILLVGMPTVDMCEETGMLQYLENCHREIGFFGPQIPYYAAVLVYLGMAYCDLKLPD